MSNVAVPYVPSFVYVAPSSSVVHSAFTSASPSYETAPSESESVSSTTEVSTPAVPFSTPPASISVAGSGFVVSIVGVLFASVIFNEIASFTDIPPLASVTLSSKEIVELWSDVGLNSSD